MIRRLSFVVLLGALGMVVGIPPAAAGGGGCYAPPDVELSTGTTAHIAECAFQPTVTYVEPGDQLTWTNKDPYDHTVTGAAASWGSDAPIAQGESVTFTFKEEGVFPYYCAYHPSMVGAVVVGDVTKAAGLTSGTGMIDPADEVSGDASTQPSPASQPTQSRIIPFALVGLLALVAAGSLWRVMIVKRRSASATARPI